MILDDYSRMIVGGRLFYQENAYNFQKVLKDAVAAYGIPNKLYVDSGAPYKNRQLDMICASIGTVLLHTPVRDGASKGKVERNFRTLKERWLYGLDLKQIGFLLSCVRHFALIGFAADNFVFSLIHIEQDIQLVQAGKLCL